MAGEVKGSGVMAMRAEASRPATVLLLTEHAGPVGCVAELVRDNRCRLRGRVGRTGDAIRAARAGAADVVVAEVLTVDRLRSLGRSGIADHAALVVVTPFAPEFALLPSLAAGARGFVRKPAPPMLVQQAVHTVMASGTFIDPASAGWLAGFALGGGRGGGPGDGQARLTHRQSQVFHLAGSGLTNRDIARALGVSVETVKTHLQGARRRLAAHKGEPPVLLRGRARATNDAARTH